MTEQAEGSPVREPRVVVGVDGSDGARAALVFALEDAGRRGVPVQVLTAYQPPESWMDFYVSGEFHTDRAERAAVEQAEVFVADVVRTVPQPAPEVRVQAVQGTAADVLVRESAGADLLVVGSRGHGGFSTMLLGSTGMQCVLHATCPVTVVHSAEAHRHRLRLRREHASRHPVP
ncbi:universal stress protein [Geodermatophilus sp. SYSU D00965]